jgi:RNA polymerase sigma-70 factor (ECF subfamily)
LNVEAIPANVPPAEWIDQQQLQQGLDELPPVYRVVLIMFYFEQCTYRQIAEELDLPIGTVMSRLARAKGHLRLRLFGSTGEAGSARTRRVGSLGG